MPETGHGQARASGVCQEKPKREKDASVRVHEGACKQQHARCCQARIGWPRAADDPARAGANVGGDAWLSVGTCRLHTCTDKSNEHPGDGAAAMHLSPPNAADSKGKLRGLVAPAPHNTPHSGLCTCTAPASPHMHPSPCVCTCARITQQCTAQLPCITTSSTQRPGRRPPPRRPGPAAAVRLRPPAPPPCCDCAAPLTAVP